MGTNPFKSSTPDVVDAVGTELDTVVDMTIDGAKLLSIKNAGSEVFAVDKDGNISRDGAITVVRPDEGRDGIENAVNTVAAAGGGIVQLLAGIYDFDDELVFSGTVKNVTLQGVGPGTILQSNMSAGPVTNSMMTFTSESTIGAVVLDNTTKGDTSIFTTTASAAGDIKKGWLLGLRGTDADGKEWGELLVAAADGNPGTGEIVLESFVGKTLTTVSITGNEANNITVQNLRMTKVGVRDNNTALAFNFGGDCLLENVIIDGFTGHAFNFNTCFRSTVDNCIFDGANIDNSVETILVQMSWQREAIVRNCTFTGVNDILITYLAMSPNQGFDVAIYNNHFQGKVNDAIFISGRFITINNNKIIGAEDSGIGCSNGGDITITGNIIVNNPTSSGAVPIGIFSCDRSTVSGNYVRGGDVGIRADASDNITICNNKLSGFSSGLGIHCSNTGYKNITIHGNEIDNYVFGIDCAGTYNNVAITNNVVRDCSSRGIGIRQTADVFTVVGNTCENNGLGILIENTADNGIIASNNCNGDGITEGTGSGNIFGLNKE